MLPLLKFQMLVSPPHTMHVTTQLNQSLIWIMICVENVIMLKLWHMDYINLLF